MLVGILCIIISLLSPCAGKVDPETGRVRVYFVGELTGYQGFPYPAWIRHEPRFVLTAVPALVPILDQAEARRNIRRYLPRTREGVGEMVDVFIWEDFGEMVFTTEQLSWYQAAIDEDGVGIALIEFAEWGANDMEVWRVSAFYEVFPADVLSGGRWSGRYEVVERRPFFDLPQDIEGWVMNNAQHSPIRARQGSVVHARWRHQITGTGPDECLVTGRYGEGLALHQAHGWDNIPPETVRGFKYLPDLIYNYLYFLAGVPIPGDVDLVNQVRSLFLVLGEGRTTIFAVMDFAEKFGANTAGLERDIHLADELRRRGESEYIDGEYALSLETVQSALDAYDALAERAMALKDRALFWVYVTEWIIVVATSMLCGSLLWTLMVRRWLYRDVGATRLGGT